MISNKIQLTFGLLSTAASAVVAQEKPNFLVILTDDQTFESLSCLNNKEIETPNLDRLVRTGTTFTHAFNQGSWLDAVSVASRSMLITGQNVFNVRHNDNYLTDWIRLKKDSKKTEVPLWGEAFKNAGYNTFMTGKWHNTDFALLKSFDEAKSIAIGMYESHPRNDKKLTQYSRPLKNKEWTPSDPAMGGNWTPHVRDFIMKDGEKVVGPSYYVDKHTSELFADEAIDYLKNYDSSKPFFMYVAFNAPHDPRQSPQSYIDKYPLNEIKIPENYLAEHPFNQGDNRVRDENLAPFPRTKESVQLHRQEYYAMITHADAMIGRVLDELERSGKGENTYVIFTADHGLAVGMHGLMGKQNMYDHSMRVPLIFTGPNIKKNKRVSGMVYMQSLFATTCDLAGIDISTSIDFKSLVPQLKKTSLTAEEYIYGCYINLQRMIRSERYKLIVYPEAKRIQLFDIEKDPYEIKNLVNTPKYKKRVAKLFADLVKNQEKVGDSFSIGNLTDYK